MLCFGFALFCFLHLLRAFVLLRFSLRSFVLFALVACFCCTCSVHWFVALVPCIVAFVARRVFVVFCPGFPSALVYCKEGIDLVPTRRYTVYVCGVCVFTDQTKQLLTFGFPLQFSLPDFWLCLLGCSFFQCCVFFRYSVRLHG